MLWSRMLAFRTSAQRRRFRPAQATLEQHSDKRLVDGAPVGCIRFRFHAAPGAPGDAGRCHDRCHVASAVSGSAWPRPRPAAWRVRPCRTRRMPSWPVGSSGAGVNVAGADRGPAFAVVLCTVSRPALDTDRSQTDGKTLSTCPSPVIHSLPPRARHRTRIPPRRSSVPQEFREYRPAGSCTAMGCESGVKRARSRPPGVRFPSLFDMQLGATPIAIGRRSTT